MKTKLKLWGVLLPPKDEALIAVDRLAIGDTGAPALFYTRHGAQKLRKALSPQFCGRVVRVKATFKIKQSRATTAKKAKGGRK